MPRLVCNTFNMRSFLCLLHVRVETKPLSSFFCFRHLNTSLFLRMHAVKTLSVTSAVPRTSASRRKATRIRIRTECAQKNQTVIKFSSRTCSSSSSFRRNTRLMENRNDDASFVCRSSAMETSSSSTTSTSNNLSAEEVVRGMYDAINERDVSKALTFIDDDIVYEDFNFQEPFRGKESVKKLFEESCTGIPNDLDFIIERSTSSLPSSSSLTFGCTWHVEIAGEPFPNARGASFYEISKESGKLIYARDVVESPMKLGEASFSIIRVVAPLVKEKILAEKKKTGGMAKEEMASSPSSSSSDNMFEVVGLWAAAATYWYVLLLSPPFAPVPGYPGWAISPEVLQDVINSSVQFFFILQGLNEAGITFAGNATDFPVQPETLAVFNFAEAFVFMLFPVLLMDKTKLGKEKGGELKTTTFWSMSMFLTNATLLPYFATRAKSIGENRKEDETSTYVSDDVEIIHEEARTREGREGKKGLLSKGFGIYGLLVGMYSLWYFANGYVPSGEERNLVERWTYYVQTLHEDRVSVAFTCDIVLFYLWQIYFTKKVDPNCSATDRFLPFFGLAGWLIK